MSGAEHPARDGVAAEKSSGGVCTKQLVGFGFVCRGLLVADQPPPCVLPTSLAAAGCHQAVAIHPDHCVDMRNPPALNDRGSPQVSPAGNAAHHIAFIPEEPPEAGEEDGVGVHVREGSAAEGERRKS